MIFNYYGAMFDTDLLSKNQEYYVYRIIDPRDNNILYIGKGKKDRYKTHLKKSHNKKLNNCIQEIRRAGHEPVVEFSQQQTNLTESQAYMREVVEVKIAWNKGQCKCNFANPGPRGSRTGCLHTLETRRKISEHCKKRTLKTTTKEKYKVYHKNRPIKHKKNLILGKLINSKFTEDLIKLIRYRYVHDVHLTIPQIASELGLKNYDVRSIGQGIRYKEIAIDTLPSKELVKALIFKRKSITSKINTTKIWQKRK